MKPTVSFVLFFFVGTAVPEPNVADMRFLEVRFLWKMDV